MAGIYIHIPFCKKACHYCDFHFSTSLQYKGDLVRAIATELKLKKDRLAGQIVETIYFGGGTPSLLSDVELGLIIDTLSQHYQIAPQAEITLEANPDDLDKAGLLKIKQFPINRFSIGIQSFFEEDLLWMNRAHHAAEAASCIPRSQDAGFENISIDLIYGYPILTDAKWQANLAQAVQTHVPHISSYSLTVEPKTALAYQVQKGLQQAPNDSQSANQFKYLQTYLEAAGFEAYEISNYAANQQYAVHNTNYWKGIPYLGIGPSAHGFDGLNRYANIANNAQYIKAIAHSQLPETWDYLTQADRFNEYIMTSLRTQWGINLTQVEITYGAQRVAWILEEAAEELAKENLILVNNSLKLSLQGKLFADGIAASLFWEDDL
ncbi:MAG: radical SAM family heme chaperone HemW [Pedobacter sp.]|nr:MAG: radical SAM family heme chaperone HemW [Pedobacter sp.]